MIPFDDFYEQYPNKKSRGQALKVWEKLKPGEELFNQIVAALQIQKRWRQEATKAGQFVPPWKMPATWLNGQCWLDQMEGTFSDLRAQQESKPVACQGGGKYCEGKAVAKGGGGLWLCPWCFSEKHADMGLLRDGFKRYGLGRKEGETQEDYRKRLVGAAREASTRFGVRQKQVASDPNRS